MTTGEALVPAHDHFGADFKVNAGGVAEERFALDGDAAAVDGELQGAAVDDLHGVGVSYIEWRILSIAPEAVPRVTRVVDVKSWGAARHSKGTATRGTRFELRSPREPRAIVV